MYLVSDRKKTLFDDVIICEIYIQCKVEMLIFIPAILLLRYSEYQVVDVHLVKLKYMYMYIYYIYIYPRRKI